MAGEQDARTAALVVGPDGVVSGWSESGRLLLGWTAEDAVGRPVTDLLAAPPPPGFPESHVGGPDHTGLVSLRHRDGSTVDVSVSAHPLFGADGRALGHAVTVQRWECRPVIADLAFEQSPFALGVYDPELRFLWINASSGRVIAHSEEQVLGRKYRELFPEFDRELFPERDDKPYTDQLAEVARTGKAARLITVFRPLGGNYANAWATSIWPVRDAEGRVRAVANWGFDMSAEYWARQRLLMLNEASRGIGRTLDVIGTARELARTSVPRFVDLVTVDLFDEVLRGEEPPLSPASASGEAVTLSRAARHSAQVHGSARRRTGRGRRMGLRARARRRPGPLAAGQPVDRRVDRRGGAHRPDHRAAPGPRRAARRGHVRPQRPARGLHRRRPDPRRRADRQGSRRHRQRPPVLARAHDRADPATQSAAAAAAEPGGSGGGIPLPARRDGRGSGW
jgi:PAS domain-containing protein